MSAYKLEDVIQKWSVGKLTTEQVIGQILMLIRERDERMQELESSVHALRQALNGDGERRARQGPDAQGPLSGSRQ